MGKPITNITIVGGGTSGWLAAAYLNHRLQWGITKRRDVSVTVIESPEVGTIGVGEATVPTLKETLGILEISEAEFIQRTDATFKLGIWFKDWNRRPDGSQANFMHPFSGGTTVLGLNPGYSFKKYGFPGRDDVTDQDFIRTISSARVAMERMLGPRALNMPEYHGDVGYAYHVDAGKLAGYLSEICVARGVTHIRDKVVDVRLDERGHIGSLQLKERGDWPVELVIDCSGFQGLLINKALKEPFESYADYLFNDRAIPIQISHQDPLKLDPVTTCTALEAGWSWNIPLQSRIGTGYVFSSSFVSDEAALNEFRTYLGEKATNVEPRILKMRVGRTQRSWVKNCIAIGLSSGFIEPLESTAIMSVELMVRSLLHMFPTNDFEQPLIDQFNARTKELYEEIRDFLSLHFTQSNRDDTPYWKAARREAKISDSLKDNLAYWKHCLPSPLDQRAARVFNSWSVTCILMGKDFYRDANLVDEELVPEETWRRYISEIRGHRMNLLDRLADHRALIDHMCSQSSSEKTTASTTSRWQSVVGNPGTLILGARPVMDSRV